MYEIRDMHDFVFRILRRSGEEKEFLTDLGPIEQELLIGIINGRFEDDNHARMSLYPQAKASDSTIHRYRRSKSVLVGKIIDQFLRAGVSFGNKYLLNRISTKKDLIAADILNLFGRQKSVRFLAFRILKKATKLHLTYETYSAYKLLSNYYSNEGPRSKFVKYSTMQKRFFDTLVLEEQVANLRRSLISEFTVKTGVSTETVSEYRAQIDRLRPLTKEFATRSIIRDFSIVDSLICRFEGRFDVALDIIEQAKKFFLENTEILTTRIIGSLNYTSLRICVNKRDYSMAIHYAALAEESFSEGGFAWFQHKATMMQLYLHTAQWNEAAALFRRVIRHSNFRASPLRLELWSVFEGFLRVLVEDKRTLPAHVTVHGEQFNILRMLQEFAVAHQDKTGLNIAVHIIHILHYLHSRKLELLDQRISALQHYFNRHTRLRKDSRFRRVRTFVHMLVVMQRSEFAADRTKERVAEELEYLCEFGPTSGNEAIADQIQSVQVEEIVPYHLIWENIELELQKIDDARLIVRTLKPSRTNNSRRGIKVSGQ